MGLVIYHLRRANKAPLNQFSGWYQRLVDGEPDSSCAFQAVQLSTASDLLATRTKVGRVCLPSICNELLQGIMAHYNAE